MKIAVLSGKGGTGKTFVSVNLAAACGNCTYIDCDAEEPNGRLFLKPTELKTEPVYVENPEFDLEKCIGCRKCVDFCRFNALFSIKGKPRLFENICHSCGACAVICPVGAVSEKKRAVGNIEYGKHGEINVVTGILNPGEELSVPVIHSALEKGFENAGKKADKGETEYSDKIGDIIIDCPPGSACPVTESVSNSDYCVLVAEPTAFGLHNFRMAHELAGLLQKGCCAVINKESENPYPPLEKFLSENNIPVVLRIPYSAELAKFGADALIAAEENAAYKKLFKTLADRIRKEARR